MPSRPPFIRDYVDRTEENRLIERLGGGEIGRKKLQERIEKYSYLNNKNWDDPRVGMTYSNARDPKQEHLEDMYLTGNLVQSGIETIPEGYGFIKLMLKKMQQSNPNVFKIPVAMTRFTPKHPVINWAIESGFRMWDAKDAPARTDKLLEPLDELNYSPEEYAEEMKKPTWHPPFRPDAPSLRFSTPPKEKVERSENYQRYVRPTLQALPNSLFAAHDWIRSTMPTSMGGRYVDETPMDYQARTGLNMDPMGTYSYFSRPDSWRPLKPKSDKNPGGSEVDLQRVIKLYHEELDRERAQKILKRDFAL